MGESGIIQTLCGKCSHSKEIITSTGSRFLLCKLSQADRRFAKYPRQPVVSCVGYEQLEEENDENR